ncbi:MAG TPA: four helix bundle protein, partial [Candidatus Paceibacterota bacterium]|nr:four helix bundle protein [Candidatus Paceibacterota bacterium]
MGDSKIQAFTDLYAWQEAHTLVMLIYRYTGNFPGTEMFGLTSQMRRAAISITSNIAEGFGRYTYKERVRFYYLAQGSLTELKSQIIEADALGYLAGDHCRALIKQSDLAHKFLQGLIKKSKILA